MMANTPTAPSKHTRAPPHPASPSGVSCAAATAAAMAGSPVVISISLGRKPK